MEVLMTEKNNTDIIKDRLLTNISDLSDADFLYFVRLFDLGVYVNKYAYPTLKYYFDESNCHIYLICLNNHKEFIGYYSENKDNIFVFVPFIFMNKQTINTLNLFGITPESEGLVFKNLIYLNKVSYYFKGYEILNSAAFKFGAAGALKFGSHFVKYTNSFFISTKNEAVTFNYNHSLYVETHTGENYIGSILSQKFKTGLDRYLSTHTLTLFDKKFNKLTKKELFLLKMYNI